jgi:hypothetical protein
LLRSRRHLGFEATEASSDRVTRFGEFSPIGQMFPAGSFLKVTALVHNYGQYFPLGKSYVLILTKIGLGCILGEFLINSLGHPVPPFMESNLKLAPELSNGSSSESRPKTKKNFFFKLDSAVFGFKRKFFLSLPKNRKARLMLRFDY